MTLNSHLQAQRLAQKLTKTSDITAWLKDMEIENFKVEAGFVSVEGNVDLMGQNLEFLPVDFKTISGNLELSMNRLRSLEGCPHSVQSFYASNNKLETLEFAPQYVLVNFEVASNQLKSLAYAPLMVDGIFDCSKNQLTRLDCPTEKVSVHFNCLANPQLVLNAASLQDFKTVVGGYLYYNATDWPVLVSTQDAGPGSTFHRIKGAELRYIQEKIQLEKATNQVLPITPSKETKIYKI